MASIPTIFIVSNGIPSSLSVTRGPLLTPSPSPSTNQLRYRYKNVIPPPSLPIHRPASGKKQVTRRREPERKTRDLGERGIKAIGAKPPNNREGKSASRGTLATGLNSRSSKKKKRPWETGGEEPREGSRESQKTKRTGTWYMGIKHKVITFSLSLFLETETGALNVKTTEVEKKGNTPMRRRK